jgi:glycerol uptake facilitator protein
MLVGQIAGTNVEWGQLPVYILAEVAGAVLAGLLYTLVLTRAAARATEPITAEEVMA